MKKLLAIIIALTCILPCFSSCKGESNETDETDIMIQPWIQWDGGPVRSDGTQSLWNNAAAAANKVNQLSVYYLAKTEDGETVYGVPTPEQYAAVMEIAAYDIEKSNELGIRVIGYSDTVQLNDKTAETMGLTLEQIAAKNADGSYKFTTAWHADGLYIACINSPEWRNWLAQNVTLTAQTGFAGLQYDFHPYAGAGLFCQCNHCIEGWKEYSKERLGEEATIPDSLDFSTELGRAYYEWKMECYCDFIEETGAEAKKINPDFMLIMNNNVNGYNFAFEALGGGMDMPTSEHIGINNGYSSGLYIYQMVEALGYDDLYSQYGNWGEVDPIFRYKTNVGESFGTIGGISYIADKDGVSTDAFLFRAARKNAYHNNESIAEVAVLWSIKSNLYSLKPNELDFGSLLFSFKTNRARQAASALVKSCVTYDFVALEVDGVLEKLDQYEVFVLPEYTYFEDETWKPVLEKIAQSGKQLIVLGEDAENYVGDTVKENVYFVPNFTEASSEEMQGSSADFVSALNKSGAREQLRIKAKQGITTVTIRQSDEAIFLNVIGRGGLDSLANLESELEFTLPEGFKLGKVKAECPFIDGNKGVKVEVKQDGDKVTIKTGKFDTYLLITLNEK